mgnify:CR=1 FL=1|tara:strand:+ start:2125 stop:2337 length:213 start_codon:yes stop_codon:yes gene_type:complete
MPDVKTFYPGATAGNPINNATDAVDATNATVATTVDDQNQTANSKIWTGTTAEYAALGSKDADTLYFVTA